ncbi:MAG: HEAT repeat domain-containing protein, partial [Deltaproteobacteria bacterium]|nr:HEAT repeat domain-containing protein [Deltaproteobacteria bacterium]
PTAREQLARAARAAEADVRDAALSLLAERDDVDAARILVDAALASAPDNPVHAALSRPGAARIAEIAARIATAPDADVPVLTSALARMHVPAATHALFDALVSTSATVRRDAASALVAIGATGALAAVRNLAVEDPDPEVRRACAAAIAG